MKSRVMLNTGAECHEILDGAETLLKSPAGPLDLSLKNWQTGTEELIACSDHFDIYKQSTLYSETDKTNIDSRSKERSVLHPKPIYCCRPVNTALSMSRITNDDHFRKSYPGASILNFESFYNNDVCSNVPLPQQFSCGSQVGQGILGIFNRQSKREMMKSNRWNCGPKFDQEMINIFHRDPKCELIKFENGEEGNKLQDDLSFGVSDLDQSKLIDTNGHCDYGQVQNWTIDNCGMITASDSDKNSHWICNSIPLVTLGTLDLTSGSKNESYTKEKSPVIVQEGTDASSDIDNSFEVLYEYLTEKDRQNSPEILHRAEEQVCENEPLLLVLDGCEDILDPEPLKEMPEHLKESLDEAGKEILDLVEPSVSLEFIEGCRFSSFSVFNQFSNLSQCPDDALSPALSFSSIGEKKKTGDAGVFSPPSTSKPVGTVSSNQKKYLKHFSNFFRTAHDNDSSVVFKSENSTAHFYGVEKTPKAPTTEPNVTALDFSINPAPLLCQFKGVGHRMEEDHHNHNGERLLCAGKPDQSPLHTLKPIVSLGPSSRTESTLHSLSQTESISSLSQRLLTSSSETDSHRESIFPLLHKKSTMFSNRELMLPSLHMESTMYLQREPFLSSVFKEPASFPNKQSKLSPLTKLDVESTITSPGKRPYLLSQCESSKPTIQRKLDMWSTESESILTFPDRESGYALTDLNSFVQKHTTNFKQGSSEVLSKFCHQGNSAFTINIEKDIKTSTSSSIDVENCGIQQEKTITSTKSLIPSPNFGSSLPKLHVLSLSLPNSSVSTSIPISPTLTSLPNLPDFASMPDSPILTSVGNSSILTSMPKSPTLKSTSNLPFLESMPNSAAVTSIQSSPVPTSIPDSPGYVSGPYSPVLTTMPNSPIVTSGSILDSPSHLSVMPKLCISPSTQSKRSNPENCSMLNFEMYSTPSVTTSPTAVVSSPCSSTAENLQQEGSRTLPPIKHKQVMIEKYHMSACTETSHCTSGMDRCDIPLFMNKNGKTVVDILRTMIMRKGRKQKPSNKNFSFSEYRKEKGSAKKRKIQESVDHTECADSNPTLQPEDLDPCETFYWCHVCEKSVKCEKDANRHHSVHGYNTKANLLFYYLQVYGCVTLHWRGYNRAEKCVYLCGLCDTTIPYINGFKRHIQTHGNYVYCDVCGKYFEDFDSLQEHKLSHSEFKSCDQESPVFATSSNKLRGTTARNYSSEVTKCKYCGKLFSSRSSLTIHIRLHTGQNPYKCQLCERSYPQNIQLKLHMKAHIRLGDLQD